MYQPSFFEQSLRSNACYGSFRQKNNNKDNSAEPKKTTPNLSRRNSFDNRTSILRRSFRKNAPTKDTSNTSLDSKENLRKKPLKISPNSKKPNLDQTKNATKNKSLKLYRSKSLDSVKMSSLNDLTRTTSCSSFFASKNTDDFLKNFLKNMSILKAGLLKEIHPPKTTKRSTKIETTPKHYQEKDDLASISSDNTTSTIGNRLYQKTTRSSLARNFEGSNDVTFEKSLRSSKRMSTSPSARIGCPKENLMPKPKVPNPKKERRRNLKKMINDGFLEKLKSRSELRLDFIKEKPRIFAVVGAKSPTQPNYLGLDKLKPEKKVTNHLPNGSNDLNDFSSRNNPLRNSFTSKHKCRPNLTSCDNKNQKISKTLKLKPNTKSFAKTVSNPISFDEAFERSLYRKCNFTNLNDSYFKSLNFFLGKTLTTAEAKTDEQITKEKQWLDTQKVWLMHRGGFALARKISGQEVEPGKVRIQLEQTGDHLNVDEDDIEKANPTQFDRLEDITNLRYLNESSILHTLRQRYASNLIHTNAGANTLLVINPMAPLAIYSEKVVALFKGCKSEDMPPHIYSVAQSAYHNMLSTRKDQSILFLGRSGSGKTTNFRHSLQYLLTATGSVNKVLTVEKLTSIWTVLESFGNCKTVTNTNATRFTQIFSLDFDQTGAIASASIQILMLEKSRICKKLEGESSFHIIQRLLFGVEGNLRKELFLDQMTGNENNAFFNLHQKHEDKQRMQIEFGKICSSMATLGIGEPEQKVLWSVLAALYHLGNAGASKVGNSNRYQFANPQSAQRAANLLGTTVEELSRVTFGLSSGGMVTPNAPRQPFRTPSPTDRGLERDVSGLEALEGLVIGLYAEVFNAVASMINKSISASTYTVSSILLVDTPGFQNPATCGRQTGASFEDLCHNYLQERLQLLYHHTNLVAPKDRYLQENIDIDLDEHEHDNLINPLPLVNLLDKTAQNTVVRTSQNDLHEADRRGMLWLLDEEAIYPGSNDESFLERLFTHYGDRDHQLLLRKAPGNYQFILQHLQGTNPVLYNCSGWLKCSRENPVCRAGITILQESHRDDINKLFVTAKGIGASSFSGSLVGIEGSQSLRRASSIRRTFTAGTAAIKRKSICLQTKFTVDGLVETLRRTKLRFVQCILPQHNAGLCEINSPLLAMKPTSSLNDDGILNIPLLRSQIRGGQILDSVRLQKLGFPSFLPLGEFRRRFRLLAADYKPTTPVLDERKAVEDMLLALDMEMTTYRVGLSQIFFRSGVLTQLESQRDEKLAGMVVNLQAHCRGYLARKKLSQRKLQDLAVRCIQRNVRKFLLVRDWPWWRLLVRVTPLLNVHRTEEELKLKTEELELLKAKLEKLESERVSLKHHNDKLEAKLSEMTADLAEEHSTSTLAAERLDAETADRIRLERELTEVQQKNKDLQNASERLEMELLYARSELNGISEDDDDPDSEAVYKQRYERAMRELEFTKRRLQQQHEDDLEQLVGLKKQLEKKLTDAYEEVEEQRQVVGQWKRKVQKLNGEMNDLKLLLEEQSARNNLLEKKQRKFDSELQLLQDELKKEKQAKERLSREKEVIIAEKFTLESNVADLRLEVDLKDEKLASIQKEVDELTYGGKTEEEVTLLRKQKIDCERRLHDQEEELDELAGQVQLLEQAKLKLEMNLEQQRKTGKKETQQHEEELEEVRCNAQKKVKALEAQLENEHEERTVLLREKHELERRLTAALENDRSEKACDEAVLQRLKRDLKRTKALLRDTQAQLERQKAENPSKTLIRQLKNQIEDLECARSAAVKTKQILEGDLSETQAQLEETVRQKNEIEEKANAVNREKADLQLQVEENEEELAEVLKKYKTTIQQMSLDQLALQEQVSLVGELEAERNNLKEQLAELTSKLDSLENAGDATSNILVKRTELKVKELESKLDLEQTTRTRLEVQISRLKEAVEKLQHDLVTSRTKEQSAQDQIRKLQRSLRELRDEHNNALTKESESLLKRKELEKRYEALEAESSTVRADLRLALKRIEDLQAVIQNDLEDSTENSDSEHDSYSSDDSVNTFLANHKISSKSSSMQFENQRRLSNTSRSSTSSNLTKDSSYA